MERLTRIIQVCRLSFENRGISLMMFSFLLFVQLSVEQVPFRDGSNMNLPFAKRRPFKVSCFISLHQSALH